MNEQDIRWIQRLDSYKKALKNLTSAVEEATKRDLSNLEQKGVIKIFEYTYELAWNSIKDFYESLEETGIQGSLDAFQLAFKRELIKNPSLMEAKESLNDTAHTYKEEVANKIFHQIIDKYHNAFLELERALEKEKEERNL